MKPVKEYGLIGYPLEHSFSPELFKELLRDRPQCSYRLFPLPDLNPDTFRHFIDEHQNLVGFNVTSPYKRAVIPYLSALTPQAQAVGAVNAVIVRKNPDGSKVLTGHNTDVEGVKATLCAFPHHKKALILGTGGASDSVAAALAEVGTEYIKVSRKPTDDVLTYSLLSAEIVKEHTLIINATPVGMYPNVNEMPDFPVQFLTPQHLVFDLIYNPSPTLLMKKAQDKGAQVTGGFVMLKAQAEAALRFWDSDK